MSCFHTNIVVPPSVVAVTSNFVSNPCMYNADLVFDFEEGLGLILVYLTMAMLSGTLLCLLEFL